MSERDIDYFAFDWFWAGWLGFFWGSRDDVIDELGHVNSLCHHRVEDTVVPTLFSFGRAAHAALAELSLDPSDAGFSWVEVGPGVVEGEDILEDVLLTLLQIFLAIFPLSELHVIDAIING